MNTHDWSPLEWTGWISLQCKGLSRVFFNTSSKVSILQRSAFFTVQLSHPYITIGKTIALTRQTLVGKVMSLLLNMPCTAAAAKLLQSCPTLCDPRDGSTPGPTVPGILQARTLEWVVIPPPGGLHPGIEPGSPDYRQILYPLSYQGLT